MRTLTHEPIMTYNIFDIINPYHWITHIRNIAFDLGLIKSHKFNIPVICVGNISVGGTGKTPHTEYLIRLLKENHCIAMLSRGYGRKSTGFVRATPNSKMKEIGDEPFQIWKKFSDIIVAVDEKRVHGIGQLLKEKPTPDIIILDDAFQHRHVKAGLNILLIDSNRPIWSDRVMPFGRLRESASAINRADIIIITKCDRQADAAWQNSIKAKLNNKKEVPVFFSTMKYGVPYPIFNEHRKKSIEFNGCHTLLMTGIANPTPLKKELEKRGAKVTLISFADHHDFSVDELNGIEKKFLNTSDTAKAIITTEKDAARLIGNPSVPTVIKQNIYAIPIEVDFLNEETNMFNQIISDYVRKNSGNSRIS